MKECDKKSLDELTDMEKTYIVSNSNYNYGLIDSKAPDIIRCGDQIMWIHATKS